MRVLIIGGGGREHALAWKLRQSARVTDLICAPGNAGIAEIAECIDADATRLESLIDIASRIRPDLTVVGPEAPLALGVVDEFARRGWRVFGPTKAAAQLESRGDPGAHVVADRRSHQGASARRGRLDGRGRSRDL